MKKMILLLGALCLSLAGCGKETAEVSVFSVETMMETQRETALETTAEQNQEISLENFSQYFELRPAAEPVIGENGDLETWDFFYGVFLKPEYADRLISGQVDFEIQFDTEHRTAAIEETTGTYELGVLTGESLESDLQQKTFGLEDFRDQQDLSIKSDFRGTVAGRAYCGSIRQDEKGQLVVDVPINGELLHAEGELLLKN